MIVEQKIIPPKQWYGEDMSQRKARAITVSFDSNAVGITELELRLIRDEHLTIPQLCIERFDIAEAVELLNGTNSPTHIKAKEDAEQLRTNLINVLGEQYVFGMLERTESQL
ncbi:hypothetical protein KBC75_00635 [Candidatus Shapirobacteria bacterium]|nr:hypothetical protein [Candidatus Shapirobacteria bacterium]